MPACSPPARESAVCTVHFVRDEMDRGPIVVQAAVPVVEGDDEARLAARVLAAEHRSYPLAVRLIAEGRVRVAGDRCVIEGEEEPGRDAVLAVIPERPVTSSACARSGL